MEQITAEYKLLALQYHPDKNEGDKEAERKFQQLKVRFSLLEIQNRKFLIFFTYESCDWIWKSLIENG